jgi:hypothetical protein
MGWADRGFFLGDYRPRLFDRNGNAGPMIMADGRVVGGWAHHPDGSIVTLLFEDVGAMASAAIAEEAASLEAWLRGSLVIPRFRTPTEVELTTSTRTPGASKRRATELASQQL